MKKDVPLEPRVEERLRDLGSVLHRLQAASAALDQQAIASANEPVLQAGSSDLAVVADRQQIHAERAGQVAIAHRPPGPRRVAGDGQLGDFDLT